MMKKVGVMLVLPHQMAVVLAMGIGGGGQSRTWSVCLLVRVDVLNPFPASRGKSLSIERGPLVYEL